MTLLLASASPRRRDLLSRLGLSFEVLAANVDERLPEPGENPDALAVELARTKALAVAPDRPGDVVLAADTVVALGNLMLGKPENEQDAIRMLSLLRDRWHTVVTGVAVICHGKLTDGSVAASVRMRDFTDRELREYATTGESMDKAGGYALQGLGGALVERVEGCANTVVGLPLCLTSRLLAACGLGSELPSGACCDRVRLSPPSAMH